MSVTGYDIHSSPIAPDLGVQRIVNAFCSVKHDKWWHFWLTLSSQWWNSPIWTTRSRQNKTWIKLPNNNSLEHWLTNLNTWLCYRCSSVINVLFTKFLTWKLVTWACRCLCHIMFVWFCYICHQPCLLFMMIKCHNSAAVKVALDWSITFYLCIQYEILSKFEVFVRIYLTVFTFLFHSSG